MRTFTGLYLILIAFALCVFGCDEGMEIADDIITSEQSRITVAEPVTEDTDDTIVVPQQVIDEESGTMKVAYAFPPHANGAIFPRKELTVFLTAEVAMRSEQYQVLIDYYTKWNTEHSDHGHNIHYHLFPKSVDSEGNLVHPFFEIITKEEAFNFLISVMESGEIHNRFTIIKNIVRTDGIIYSDRLHLSLTTPLSDWENLVFPADAPDDITWFTVRIFAKNTGELEQEEIPKSTDNTDNMVAEPIAEEPTIWDEMPAPVTIGSFGFGSAEDVFKDKDVITYFEYVNRWAEGYCNRAKNPLNIMLFDFPNRTEAAVFQRLLGANLIIGDIDEDIVISDDTVYLRPSDPCAFQIDISP